MIFTRYLYLQDEVKIALMVSLLNKSNASIFWAYELYYSGFENELFRLLWKIYYAFYYTLNPAFQQYFIKKHKDWLKMGASIERDKIICIIVNNLLIRPFNLDVFMLKQTTKTEKSNKTTTSKFLHTPSTSSTEYNLKTEACLQASVFLQMLQKNKYVDVAEYILHQCPVDKLVDTLNSVVEYFISKNMSLDKTKIMKNYISVTRLSLVDIRVLLLSNIMHYYSLEAGLTMGKKLYIIVDPSDIVMYETITTNDKLAARDILPIACMYNIDEHQCLSLFTTNRNNLEENGNERSESKFSDYTPERQRRSIQEMYWYHWVYYASFSPIWLDRITKHKGVLNHIDQKVEFIDDDHMEEFYDQFGYEPDEQKRETQEKNIQPIKNIRTWSSFYEEFKHNSLYKQNSITNVTKFR